MLEGLHPNRPTHILRITTDERSARAMTDLIGEIFDPAETAVAAFETTPDGPWLLEAYFAREPDERAVRDLIRPVVGAEADKGVFVPLEQRDWVQASLDGLDPVRAGRILVHGAHDRARRRSNDLSIEIEAALAFGTGHHGTTKGCLLAFVDEMKLRRPRHVLDVGTGTGVLAFAAAKSLRRTVVAGDIDPVAIQVARDNARLNGIGSWLRLYVGPGTRHPAADRPGHFDLVFANILARPLRRLAPALARVCTNDGTLILSGLLGGDVPGVLSAYAAQGWHLRRRYDLEGWVALVLTRHGSAPRPRRG
ncbi:MAG: 50S ribosomal protein L11 methyltransferase [Microvirga sp.]